MQPCVLNSFLNVLGIFEISLSENFKAVLSVNLLSCPGTEVSALSLSIEMESAAAFKTAIAISSLPSGIARMVFKMLDNSCSVNSP